MQNIPEPYNQIIADPNHWFEVILQFLPSEFTSFDVRQDKLFSVTTTHSVFSDNVPQIGCAVSGEIDATFIKPDNEIPKMCPFRVLVRARTETLCSVAVFKGTYFIDTREVSHNSNGLDVMHIHGYDAMLKFEQMYPDDSTHDYPLLDVTMLQFMAASVGIGIDQRTLDIMDRAYLFSLPVGYTMREILGYIASAYGGNFVISENNQLLLLALGGIPEETNYLIDQIGDVLLFGDTRILV